MEKTPDETKRGLKVCHSAGRVLAKELWCEKQCPYMDEAYGCGQDYLHADALSYFQQLEAANAELLTKAEQLETKCHQLERERDALMHWARGRCDTCAHNDDCVKHDPDPEGLIVHWYDDCESWEWRGVKEE